MTELILEDLTPHCDLDLEHRNETFLHGIPGHGDTPSYQVWLHTVHWFGRGLPGKGGTHRQTINPIQIYRPSLRYRGIQIPFP